MIEFIIASMVAALWIAAIGTLGMIGHADARREAEVLALMEKHKIKRVDAEHIVRSNREIVTF